MPTQDEKNLHTRNLIKNITNALSVYTYATQQNAGVFFFLC